MKMPTQFWVGISGGKLGGERGNRTHDTRIFSPLLYHLSYLAILFATSFKGKDLQRQLSRPPCCHKTVT